VNDFELRPLAGDSRGTRTCLDLIGSASKAVS